MSHVDKTQALYHQEVFISPQTAKQQREQNNENPCETKLFWKQKQNCEDEKGSQMK